MSQAETCERCKRPVWDGGHAINIRECVAPLGGDICDLVAERDQARALVEVRGNEVNRLAGEVEALTRIRDAFTHNMTEVSRERDRLRELVARAANCLEAKSDRAARLDWAKVLRAEGGIDP